MGPMASDWDRWFVVDTSAIITVAFEEPGWQEVHSILGSARSALIPAPAFLEACMVISRVADRDATAQVERVLSRIGATVVPLDHACARLAVEAFLEFGKGRHPAQLNFGDCMVYAVAKLRRLPILCTGDDFAQTGIATLPSAR